MMLKPMPAQAAPSVDNPRINKAPIAERHDPPIRCIVSGPVGWIPPTASAAAH